VTGKDRIWISHVKPSNCLRFHPTSMISKQSNSCHGATLLGFELAPYFDEDEAAKENLF